MQKMSVKPAKKSPCGANGAGLPNSNKSQSGAGGMMLHIYTEPMQPATGWTDSHSGEPMEMGFEPEQMIYTRCCGVQRAAKDCVVQCFYDGLSIWCAPEKGCKDPQLIADKRAREFANRSAGQRARWAKYSAGGAGE